ncbi:hypothetical protein HK102_013621 [Quaeritorhiza haematococci]|nr:hypothetical protein HK102_013621 [Quaeritorhiza haematococci]
MAVTPKNCAWATLITKDNYVVGVQTLARSLHTSKTKYPLVVMYTSAVTPTILTTLTKEHLPIILRQVDDYRPTTTTQKVNYAFERFSEVWTKLRAWELDEYEKVCCLDADMLVLRNMDELFDDEGILPEGKSLAACHACVCNPKKFAHYPKWWVPENCRYTALGRGEALQPGKPRYFNSGLFLIRPSKTTLSEMLTQLQNLSDLTAYQFPDQDFLNEFWSAGDRTWVELPYIYNALKTLHVIHKDVWDIKEVKNIHYILDKPWDKKMYELESAADIYDDLNRLWWAVYMRLNDRALLENAGLLG